MAPDAPVAALSQFDDNYHPDHPVDGNPSSDWKRSFLFVLGIACAGRR